MPRLTIDSSGTTRQVTERYKINSKGNIFEQIGRYLINPDTLKLETIWELIISYIFSKDGFGIQTKDGYIIKLKDQ